MEEEFFPVFEFGYYEIPFGSEGSKIVAPKLGLEIAGTSKNPVVKQSNIKMESMREIFRDITHREPSLDELIAGFKGRNPKNGFIYYFCRFDDETSKRLIRLMQNKPTLSENVRYVVNLARGSNDPYRLGKATNNIYDFFRNWEGRTPAGIRYETKST